MINQRQRAKFFRSETSDKRRKPRHENGGKYQGDNADVSLLEIVKALHRIADKPRRVYE